MVFVVSSTIVAAPADNANSYITAANLASYVGALYPDVTFTYTVNQQTGALLRAMKYLESFSQRYVGSRTASSQPLSWPRAGVVVFEASIESTVIPDDIKEAQALTALEILRGFDPLKSIKYEDILSQSGVLSGLQNKSWSQEYLDDYGVSDRLVGVQELLAPYLNPLTTRVY